MARDDYFEYPSPTPISRRVFLSLLGGLSIIDLAGCFEHTEADHPQLVLMNETDSQVELRVTLRNESGKLVFSKKVTLAPDGSDGSRVEYYDIVKIDEYKVKISILSGPHTGTMKQKQLGIGGGTAVRIIIETEGVSISL